MTDFDPEKPLEALSKSEWESLCDGCARCCLIKLEDEDTNQLYYTAIACALLDLASCKCSDYQNRSKRQTDCVELNPDNVDKLKWLPKTCAYRMLAEGKQLKPWHPLISGSKESVHDTGVSVRSFASIEQGDEDLEEYIIELK